MSTEYEVELIGEVREVYWVRADSADDARARWSDGTLVLSEAFGMDVEAVREVSE